jgi:ABC-2 type transport system ATP-binding protein
MRYLPGMMRERRSSATIAAMQASQLDSLPARARDGAEATAQEPVVSVQGLSKHYGEVIAVDQLSFTLESGSITGFLGPNGSGKTTTLRVLLGLAEPSSGDALVLGRRYRELEDPSRKVGALLESDDFDPARSGRNHLRLLAIASGIGEDRVEELLELVELTRSADRPVRTCSLGMRQRLGLAAALLGDPEILLLDEPANGLDPAGVHWLRGFLHRLAADGRTVLVSSHVLAEVAQTVQRAIIISGGRLLGTVELDELEDGAASLETAYLELTGTPS